MSSDVSSRDSNQLISKADLNLNYYQLWTDNEAFYREYERVGKSMQADEGIVG